MLKSLVLSCLFCVVIVLITVGSLFPFNFRLPAEYVWNTLTEGKRVYSDRDYIYTSVPSMYAGFHALRTKNNDKYSIGKAFIVFNVSTPVTVYVAHVKNELSKPRWLQSWENTGDYVHASHEVLHLYKKAFSAGIVSLEGNEAGDSMYTVIVESHNGVVAITNTVTRSQGAWEAFLDTWNRPTTLWDAVINVVLFVPFGYFGVRAMRNRHRVITSSLGLMLALALQITQIYVPMREPDLQDVLWNLLGTVAGALLAPVKRVSSTPGAGPAKDSH